MTTDELHRALRQLRLSGRLTHQTRSVGIRFTGRAMHQLIGRLFMNSDSGLCNARTASSSVIAVAVNHILLETLAWPANEAGFSFCYREARRLLRDIASATASGEDIATITELMTVPLLIVDDLDMSNLPRVHAEHLLELILRRYTKASTIIISSSSLAELSKYGEYTPVQNALIDRFLHRRNVIDIRGKSD